jgi:hypothetical protein
MALEQRGERGFLAGTAHEPTRVYVPTTLDVVDDGLLLIERDMCRRPRTTRNANRDAQAMTSSPSRSLGTPITCASAAPRQAWIWPLEGQRRADDERAQPDHNALNPATTATPTKYPRSEPSIRSVIVRAIGPGTPMWRSPSDGSAAHPQEEEES